MKKSKKIILFCILFVFLFSLIGCFNIELDFGGDEKNDTNTELIAKLRKRKGELRKEIGTLDKALSKNLYPDPEECEKMKQLKTNLKNELNKISDLENTLQNNKTKQKANKIIQDRSNKSTEKQRR